MKIVVLGATGPSGVHLVRAALDRGHHVAAVSRRTDAFPIEHANLTVERAQVTDAADVRRVIAGADAVASTLGVPFSRKPIDLYSTTGRILVEAMHEQGSTRLIVTTSASVADWHDPAWGRADEFVVTRVLARLGATLYADMRRLEEIVMASDLDWTIMRPLGLGDVDLPTEYSVAIDHISGKYTDRRDLASAIVDELEDRPERPAHHRQRVAVATTNRSSPFLRTIWREGIRPNLPGRRR